MSFCVNKSSSIFLGLFKFFNFDFVSEEMVWQTVLVFDDFHEEGVLEGVQFR